MAFDRDELSEDAQEALQSRGLFALALALGLTAVGSQVAGLPISRALASRFETGERDRAIDAAPVTAEATLMSMDAAGPGRMIVSYEYYSGIELFVGYAQVPVDATLAWKRLGPIDIEHAAERPGWSRPVGVTLAPRAWITDGWIRWSPRLPLVPLAGAVVFGALGFLRRRR